VKQEPSDIPDLKERTSIRWTKRDKQNLRLLMLDQRVTSVSDAVRHALEQQAEPVRQRWTEAASRIAQEEERE